MPLPVLANPNAPFHHDLTPPDGSLILLQKLLRLINLRRQIRTAPPVGMIQQHQLPVILAYLVFRQCPFPVHQSAQNTIPRIVPSRTRLGRVRCVGWVSDVRQFQNQRRFSPIHALFKSAFVEGSSDRIDAATVATQGYEAGSSLFDVRILVRLSLRLGSMGWEGRVDVPGKQRWRRQRLLLWLRTWWIGRDQDGLRTVNREERRACCTLR